MAVDPVTLFTTPLADANDPSTFAERANTNFGEVNVVLGSMNTSIGQMNADFDAIVASALAGDLPPLTGYGGSILGVNQSETGATFFSPSLGNPFRNKIINGQFNIWQRGTTFTATGYTADRWYLTEGSGSSNGIDRQGFPRSNTEIPNPPQYYLLWSRATAGSAASFLEQRIEDVDTLTRKTATVTFWVRSNAATELHVDVDQVFGTGGTPSSDVSVATETFTTSTTWTKKTLTFSVPTTAGKIAGTDLNDHLRLRFRRDHDDPNPTTSLFLTNVSLVEGDATNEEDPGAWRNVALEAALCNRYYRKILRAPMGAVNASEGTTSVTFQLESGVLTPTMRATPSASLSGGSATNCTLLDVQASTDYYAIRVNGVSTPANFEIDGGTLIFDAEL